MICSANRLRFQITASDGRCSDVWRGWSVGNEVYLAPRVKGGEFKISLHQSGKWRLAFTKEYADRMRELETWAADRCVETLDRPTEHTTGLTRAVRIYFLDSELRLPETRHENAKNVAQVPGPPSGGIRVVDLIFTTLRSRFTPANPPPGQEALASWRLPNGETLWIIHFELAGLRELDSETEQFRMNLANAKKLDNRSPLRLNDPSGRIMIAGTNDMGWFCVIDAAIC